MLFIPFIAIPNRFNRGLFSGRFNQSYILMFRVPGQAIENGASNGENELVVSGLFRISAMPTELCMVSSELNAHDII